MQTIYPVFFFSMGTGDPCKLSVDVGDALDEMKREISRDLRKELGMENVRQVARMSGLGRIRFVPEQFNGTQFALGILTLPNLFNFAGRLAEAGVLLPKIDRAVSSGVLTGGTLVVHLFTGGGSFTLGALLGQVPIFMDALATKAIMALEKKSHGQQGIGQTEEDELRRLRMELDKLGAVDSAEGSAELPGEGLVPGATVMAGREMMVVN